MRSWRASLELARRGYEVVGVDGSPRRVEVARTRAARDEVVATFDVGDVRASLRFADGSLEGVLAVLVVQHLRDPSVFIAEIRRCHRPGGHLLIIAPARDGTSLRSQNLYWRLHAITSFPALSASTTRTPSLGWSRTRA
jgi:SAM-dependent methyltransferase